MKLKFTLIALLTSAMAFAQPANDDCANATPIVMGGPEVCMPTVGDNTGATDSGVAHGCAFYQGGDVWFTVVVPSTGIAIIETSENGGFTDGGLAVYSGDCDNLVELDCNDDGGEGAFSLITLTDLTPGEQLYIAVWEYGGNAEGQFNICAYQPPVCPDIDPGSFALSASGADFLEVTWESLTPGSTYHLEYGPQGFTPGDGTEITGVSGTDGPPVNVGGLETFTFYDFYLWVDCGDGFMTDTVSNTFNTPPGDLTNDDCEGATPLVVNGPSDCQPTTGFNDGATDSGVAHPCANYQGGDVWFSFVAPADGAVYVETSNAGGFTDGGLAVYGGECGSLELVDCNDDGGEGLFSLLTLNDLTPGDVYYAAVWEYGGNAEGVFNICVYAPPTCPTPNFLFTDSLTANSAFVSWDAFNTGATYFIEYGADGFTPGTGTTVSGVIGTDGPPVELPGLDPTTVYDYYFQAACGPNDSTELIGPFGFTTLESCQSNSVFTIDQVDAGFDFATINWNAYNTGATFFLEYGEPGFAPGTGTTVTGIVGIDGPPVTLNGLFISSNYELYLQEACDVNDSTDLVGPVAFETLSPPPANDSLCDAIELTVNALEAPFNNEGATPQVGEPEGSCWGGSSEIETVWFHFVAPESGVVTVTTDYPDTELHDTHIAIYSLDGGDCNNLSTLVEVGCDEDGGIQAPNGWTSTAVMETLTPGETYYVQVDGWLASDGEFLIRVFEGLVGIDELGEIGFEMYPNPAESILNITSDELEGQVTIEIFDINGRLAMIETVNMTASQNTTLDVNSLRSGLYSVRLSNAGAVSHARLIIE